MKILLHSDLDPSRVRAQYDKVVQMLERDDPDTAELIAGHVEKSLSLIQPMPSIGTPTARPGVPR